MSRDHDLFTTIASGLGALHLLVTGIAVFLCWAHRRISPWMNLVVGGLVGLFLSGMVGHFVPFVLVGGARLSALKALVPTVVGLASWALVVFGLAATLHDVRRLISLAKDRRHDLE